MVRNVARRLGIRPAARLCINQCALGGRRRFQRIPLDGLLARLFEHHFRVATGQERLELLHLAEVRTQPIAQSIAEALARRPQSVQLKDELHPMPDRDAQCKDGVSGVEAFHTPDSAQWNRDTAPPAPVALARKAQERWRERQAARVHEVLLPLLVRVRDREHSRNDLGADARGVYVRPLIRRQSERVGELLRPRRWAVVAQRMDNRRHPPRR